MDQHFGQVSDFYIYDYQDQTVCFRERRQVGPYCTADSCDGHGGGQREGAQVHRMQEILKAVADCSGVICLRIGEAPRLQLEERQIQITTTFDQIEKAVAAAAQQLHAARKGA
ncbi:MAG: NifB/NifX family molybdenum-iron cluster-binding protein [Oscillospiraceae bacterium]|nr:NifB/NifX family molybdenum-iron cluster-binding protein [Oscillospiraceae bacterium]